jgi:hypothetical protein
MSYVYIGNIEDQVTGALHQVTLEELQQPDGTMELTTRINGTLISTNAEFHLRAVAAYQAWQDSYAGLEDLDDYLFKTEVMPPLEAAITKARESNG